MRLIATVLDAASYPEWGVSCAPSSTETEVFMVQEATGASRRKELQRAYITYELWRYRLRDRDVAIMNGLALNKTYVALSAELGISTKTIQRSISQWCERLGFASASDLLLKWKIDPQNAGQFLTGSLRAGVGGSDLVEVLGRTALRVVSVPSVVSAPVSDKLRPDAVASPPAYLADSEEFADETLATRLSPWLNPLFWHDVVTNLRELRLRRTTLPFHVYTEFEALLWCHPKPQQIAIDLFNARNARYPRIWLLAALAARAVGTPFAQEVTSHELDYLRDGGRVFRERCRREDLFTLDVSEGLVSPESGVAFWTAMYPTLLNRSRRPRELRSVALAVQNCFCPIVGMVAQTLAVSNLLADHLNVNETKTPWLLLCQYIAKKRLELAQVNCLDVRELTRWRVQELRQAAP